MPELVRTDVVESYEELFCTLVWDDDESPEAALAGGIYTVCGGEWRREQDNQWRFWEDLIVTAELKRA
jgi:hypothetical protein